MPKIAQLRWRQCVVYGATPTKKGAGPICAFFLAGASTVEQKIGFWPRAARG